VEGEGPPSNWSAFEAHPRANGAPAILDGQRAGPACDQWNRHPDDIRLLRALGLNAYRFSLAWNRIEPAPGRFDEQALDRYAFFASALADAGIQPVVTLHHFAHPLWFEEMGAFLHPGAGVMFSRFVTRCVERLRHVVRWWIPVNEPSVYALNGYATGEFPPARTSPSEAVRVLHALLRAHELAYRTIKELDADARVGPALNIFHYLPARRFHPLDRLAARLAQRVFSERLVRFLGGDDTTFRVPGIGGQLKRLSAFPPADFIGINYYTRLRLAAHPGRRVPIEARTDGVPREALTEMEWEIHPEGLLLALRQMRAWCAVPLLVTENGIADGTDRQRPAFIRDHLAALDAAVHEHLDVRGYFHWSLLDNFEWTQGYARRFGLYAVDFATQARTLREGGAEYARLIRARVRAAGQNAR
jgi:beta-glucosidase